MSENKTKDEIKAKNDIIRDFNKLSSEEKRITLKEAIETYVLDLLKLRATRDILLELMTIMGSSEQNKQAAKDYNAILKRHGLDNLV